MRGARGENRVIRKLESRLPKDEYRVFNDVTLDSSRGETQIDHIVVSRYGVFVIETKNYSGWIFGNERSKQWTQVLYRKKYRFMNPLRQNYKHVRAVSSFLSVESRFIHSIVVFAGNAKFKTSLPSNVIYLRELSPYIRAKRDQPLSSRQFDSIVHKLTSYQLGAALNRRDSTLLAASAEPDCPRCGAKMVRRTADRGSNAGRDFWGCLNFPKCRGVRSI